MLHLSPQALKEGASPFPLVVCCHGMLSSMQSAKLVAVAERLAHQGLSALRFDFTGCGRNESAFGESLVGSRVEDLEEVLDWVEKEWGAGPVGLFGSSLGGFVSLVVASRDPHRVGAVVTWAAPCSLWGLLAHKTLPRPSTPTWPSSLALGEPATVPESPGLTRVLVAHGIQDELVPWSHAVDIYGRLGEPKRLWLLEEGDHRFLDEAVRKKLLAATVEWFQEYLQPPELG
ncbi:alpha/beta hydrolase family protein [Desulfacinum hydrothermale]|nr:alpha/beta fold hydrolase [Desulfacinum hydrothermale]